MSETRSSGRSNKEKTMKAQVSMLVLVMCVLCIQSFAGGLFGKDPVYLKLPPAPVQVVQVKVDADLVVVGLAEKYIDLYGVPAVVGDAVRLAIKSLPPEDQVKFNEKRLVAAINMDLVRALMVKAMAETFDEEELRALVAFYSSPVGKRCMKKSMIAGAEMSKAMVEQLLLSFKQQS